MKGSEVKEGWGGGGERGEGEEGKGRGGREGREEEGSERPCEEKGGMEDSMKGGRGR